MTHKQPTWTDTFCFAVYATAILLLMIELGMWR